MSNTKGKRNPMLNLTKFRSVAFTVRTAMAIPNDSGSWSSLLPGQTLSVVAVIPNMLCIKDVTTKEDLSAFSTIAAVACSKFVSNGLRQIEIDEIPGKYITHVSASTLDRITSTYGLTRLIAPDILFNNHPLEGFTLIGEEAVSNEPAYFYVCRQSGEDIEEGYNLYVSKDTGLPLRISAIFKSESGDEVEGRRTDFIQWELDKKVSESLFDVAPPPNTRSVETEPLFNPIFKPGMEPSPLYAEDRLGNLITLDQYLGKVLLLHFWASWCYPCRTGLLRIIECYNKYHLQGFEVISISLDYPSTRDQFEGFVKQKTIRWPQIWDGQGFDSILAAPYQVKAVPFSILIGRDGKITAINPIPEELEETILKAL